MCNFPSQILHLPQCYADFLNQKYEKKAKCETASYQRKREIYQTPSPGRYDASQKDSRISIKIMQAERKTLVLPNVSYYLLEQSKITPVRDIQ